MFGLGSIISGISSVLSVVATRLMPAIGKIIGPILEPFAKAIEAFMKSLGLLGNEERVEELGDRALQAEADELHPIKVESFDSHEKYLEALKEYELDEEKSARIDPTDKMHRAIEILMGLAIETYGQPMMRFGEIVVSDPQFYSKPGRLSEFGNVLRTDRETFDDIVNYIEGKGASTEKNDAAFNALVKIEKAVEPTANDADVWRTVSGMKK